MRVSFVCYKQTKEPLQGNNPDTLTLDISSSRIVYKRKIIKINHCATKLMIVDFFTRPLQGNLFVKFCEIILGQVHASLLTTSTPSVRSVAVGNTIVPEERSGNWYGPLYLYSAFNAPGGRNIGNG